MTSAGVVADGYTVELDVDLAGADRAEALYQIPGCLSLAIREVGVGGEADALREFDTLGNNYLNFPGDDGRVLVLEGVVGGPAGRVGLPLALLGGDRARVVLDWKDYRLSLVCGGRADFDFPWHRVPQWTPGAEAQILSPRVKAAAFVSPAKSASALGGFFAEGETLKGPIQYWTPAGHNAWVGDVALCRFWGRLHLFYLYDRRHHRSKGGKGGHFFAHISSADLTTWVQHAPAVTIDDWWQTVGTGTPFELDGKLHLAYGLHTSRFMPEEETTCPELDAYYRRHGRMGVFKFADLAGYPMGATYCSSADGIHFEPSRVLFHTAQNPTVCNLDDGRLCLVNSYGGTHGLYVSDHLGDWTLADGSLPIDGDCPCLFAWNGRHYLLQGFDGMAYSPDGKPGTYVNWTESGDSVYGGLSVPMVAAWDDDRRILAGWLGHPGGWGGWLVFRELVQFADGKLGERWLPEAMPAEKPLVYSACDPSRPFAVRFAAAKSDGAAVEIGVDPGAGRAYVADVGPDGKAVHTFTPREVWAAHGRNPWDHVELRPHGGASYAIEHVRGLDRPYQVRVIVHYDPKGDATIFDAEIAMSRTLLARRPGRFAAEPATVR